MEAEKLRANKEIQSLVQICALLEAHSVAKTEHVSPQHAGLIEEMRLQLGVVIHQVGQRVSQSRPPDAQAALAAGHLAEDAR